MPVTAKLSRRFYEQFGDELANELVDWFNTVDATYRSDLRELNELNFARFDAKLEQRLTELDGKWERRFAQLDAKWEQRFAQLEARWEKRLSQLDAKWEQRFAQLETRIAELRLDTTAQLAAFEARIVRWMFTLWVGTTVTIGGMVVAAQHFR